eukprot:GILK01005776.1.p1 GENE.GILK01005776.1~~GILK01005776.1.p1  ORF type:complete len:210 (+),score=35.65 GILK01005776.1:35-631(+)
MPAPDLNALESVPVKRTIALVNNFIINTSRFINNFSDLCEDKLSDCSRNIQRLEIVMSILEAKLNSIPELATMPAQAPAQAQVASAPPPPEVPAPPPPPSIQIQAPSSSSLPPPPPPPPVPVDMAGSPLPSPSPSPIPGADLLPPMPEEPKPPSLADDPRYAIYFKMIKMGVPMPSVIQKMSLEGVDPAMLLASIPNA